MYKFGYDRSCPLWASQVQCVSVSLPVIADSGGLEAQAHRHSVLVCFFIALEVGRWGLLMIVQGTKMWKWQYFCTVSKRLFRNTENRGKCYLEFFHFNKYMVYFIFKFNANL